MTKLRCYFCGRSFKNKHALNCHLRWCNERKKAKDRWIRFLTSNNGIDETICIVSRSPKTMSLIEAEHAKYQAGRIPLAVFHGYLDAMRHLKLIEYKIEEIAARTRDAPEEVSA